MRFGLLVLCLALVGCARRPSAEEAYANSWKSFRQGHLKEAEQAVDLALRHYRGDQTANVALQLRLLKIESLLARTQTQDALTLLNQLKDPSDQPLHLRWLADQAEAAAKLGHTDKALEILDQLDRTASSDSNDDSVFKGRLLRGSILARSGHLRSAEDVLRETATQAAKAGDIFNQAAALGNLSSCKIRENRFDESLEYSRAALDLAEKTRAERLAAMANDNLGIAYGALGDLDRAEQHQNRAIQDLGEVGDLRNLADSLGALGYLYLRRHEPAKAVDQFKRAVQIAASIDDIGEAGKWSGRVAYALAANQDWSAADSWNRQAYARYRQLGQHQRPAFLVLTTAAVSAGLGKTADAERTYRELIAAVADSDPFVELNARLRFGELLSSQNRFPEANAQFEQGIAGIERTVSRLIKDDYRLTYYDLQNEFFKAYVDLLVTEKKEIQALRVAEYSRARVLAQKIGSPSSKIGQIQPASFQQYASENRAVLLSYWLGQKRSFVWIVKGSGITMRELPGEATIRGLVEKYAKSIDDQRDPVETGSTVGEELSGMLLGPLRQDRSKQQRVVVVPDGDLHGLNLETLPVGEDGHYWIENAEVSVAPSLSLLTEPLYAQSHRRNSATPSVLLIGAPTQASSDYPELPAAKSEIEGIQHVFANAETYTGSGATPQGFLDSNPSRFSLIHFAAHAEANPASPLDSAVILAKNQKGDGYKLYARDIADKKLSADLVTLSACRSAGARVYGGEGLVGFTWAFLESGAQAVIAGLWEVGDQSSSRLMGRLYQALASGDAPPTALREAKLDLLRSGTAYRKPFYWAAYQTYIR